MDCFRWSTPGRNRGCRNRPPLRRLRSMDYFWVAIKESMRENIRQTTAASTPGRNRGCRNRHPWRRTVPSKDKPRPAYPNCTQHESRKDTFSAQYTSLEPLRSHISVPKTRVRYGIPSQVRNLRRVFIPTVRGEADNFRSKILSMNLRAYPANDAHHRRRASDLRHVTEPHSRRPVHEPG